MKKIDLDGALLWLGFGRGVCVVGSGDFAAVSWFSFRSGVQRPEPLTSKPNEGIREGGRRDIQGNWISRPPDLNRGNGKHQSDRQEPGNLTPGLAWEIRHLNTTLFRLLAKLD